MTIEPFKLIMTFIVLGVVYLVAWTLGFQQGSELKRDKGFLKEQRNDERKRARRNREQR